MKTNRGQPTTTQMQHQPKLQKIAEVRISLRQMHGQIVYETMDHVNEFYDAVWRIFTTHVISDIFKLKN